jgi:hypothetical protein
MQTLGRGQRSDLSHPALSVFTPIDGVLDDVDVVEFVILDRSGDAPVQAFPEAGRAAAARLGVGHYVALYTPPASAQLGHHVVRWFARAASGELHFETPFEVLAAPIDMPQPGYCMLQDLRDEGFGPDAVSDARLTRAIALASRTIERVTGRFFEPRRQRIELDGRGSNGLLLDEPIIAIEKIEIGGGGPVPGATVYNRHITQGLMLPDDRQNPRIRFGFPCGARNVRVTGLFGYTEPDGSPTGTTPLLIREACKRLVVGEIPLLADTGRREDARQRYRIVQERTREQSYTLDRLAHPGALTGDPDIDDILVQFMRPADLGAA